MELDFLYMLQELHSPLLDKIMVFFTTLGNVGIIWIIIVAILLCQEKHRFCGVRLGVVLALCLILGCIGLKNLIGRDRPCWIDPSIPMLIKIPSDYSFPSGHTMSSFACAHVLFLYKHRWGFAAYLLAAAIAFSRMYLFVHFPTDILGGLVIGLVLGTVTNLLMMRFYEQKHSVI